MTLVTTVTVVVVPVVDSVFKLPLVPSVRTTRLVTGVDENDAMLSFVVVKCPLESVLTHLLAVKESYYKVPALLYM